MQTTMDTAAAPSLMFGFDANALLMGCGLALLVVLGVASWLLSAHSERVAPQTVSKEHEDDSVVLDSNGQKTTLRRRVTAKSDGDAKTVPATPEEEDDAPKESKTVEPLFFKEEESEDAEFNRALDELTRQAKESLKGQEAASAAAQKAAHLATTIANSDPESMSADERREALSGLVDSLLLLCFGEEWRDVIGNCSTEDFDTLLSAGRQCVEEMGVAQPDIIFNLLARRMVLVKRAAFDQIECKIQHQTKKLTGLVDELRDAKNDLAAGGITPHPVFEKFLDDALGSAEWSRLKTTGGLRVTQEQFAAIRALAEKMLPEAEAAQVYEGVTKWLMGEAMGKKDKLILEQMKSEELRDKAMELSELNREYNDERDKFDDLIRNKFGPGARPQATAETKSE
eukprot:GDKI01033763.1.p1 GENE.GDKI01033763.1~~GDKI01033763.1.p1  ORF type:complete len:399 (+),score=167.36 GDKI01033763.1:141-1337(+)